MKTPLARLLFDNPFTNLTITVDESDDAVRHRFEELEMEAQFSDGQTADRNEIVYARQMLDDPRVRVECEFFVPWDTTTAYNKIAGPHDAALRSLRRIMDRSQIPDAGRGLTVLRRWSALLSQTAIVDVLNQRFDTLGVHVPVEPWLSNVVAETVFPDVVKWILTHDGGLAVDLGDALSTLPVDHITTASLVLAEHIDGEIEDTRVMELAPRHVIRLGPLVARSLAPVRASSRSTYYGKMSTLVGTVISRSWAEHSSGRTSVARELLESLMSLELLESDQIVIRERLGYLRT